MSDYERRMREVLLELVARYPYGYTTAELAALLEWSSHEVSAKLRALKGAGLVEFLRPFDLKGGRARWWATWAAVRAAHLLMPDNASPTTEEAA